MPLVTGSSRCCSSQSVSGCGGGAAEPHESCRRGGDGHVGTSVVRALEADNAVTSIVGIARRLPGWQANRTEWRQADVAIDDLAQIFDGADAVVHLAWLFQPTRYATVTWRANVLGSMRVFRAVAEAGVSTLVYASSVGAYSPGPKDRAVDESWPTHGWPGAAYGREKAYVERLLDICERDQPGIRVVRMRPGFIFKRRGWPGASWPPAGTCGSCLPLLDSSSCCYRSRS
jgi:UDP-glucose 4-epimerase